jgi:ribonuclease BN (tRNA processing enzyme)
LKLTVLGNSAAYPGPNTPCSGYLFQDGDRNILIDCGTGTLSNLQAKLDLRQITEIIITHMHADHFFDLIPYRYALRYGFDGAKIAKLRLFLPPGGTEVLNRVVAPFAEVDTFFSDVFNISEFNPGSKLAIGNLALNFTPVKHYIPAYAVSILGVRRFAYSSDSGMCPELLEAARDADLFLCAIGKNEESNNGDLWGHLLPEEAGNIARKSGARRLMLTHMWPMYDPAIGKQQASKASGLDAEVAEVLHTYEI